MLAAGLGWDNAYNPSIYDAEKRRFSVRHHQPVGCLG
jgi:hypothetical protein